MATKLDIKATLVMESRGLAPSVRGHSFSNDWSRLYQADAFYLDLMLKPSDKQSTLIGQLLSEDGVPLEGQVILTRPDAHTSASSLGRDASFFIDILQPASYQLSITLSDTTISISDLVLN